MARERVAGRNARVLVVSQPSLFEDGIEELLRQEQGLEIVGREADPQEVIRRNKQGSPGVVILVDGEGTTGLEAELLGLVREGFRIRVLEVHRGTNALCVYCGEQQPIREAGDLAQTVQHICGGLTREPEVPPTPAMRQQVP